MPDHKGSKQQKRYCMPGQESEIREKLKKVRDSSRQAGMRNNGETSATHLSGSYNPDLMTDYDAVEIFNIVLHRKQ